jgi:thioredoxin reductase (NADPH)
MQEKASFEVIIAGGGPAGLAALHWCAELGLTAVLVEKEPEFGGQLLQTYNPVTNYLGLPAANGRELRDRFLACLPDNMKRLTDSEIVTADVEKKLVVLADGRELGGRALVVATGVRRRELGIPGEHEFRGRGILDSGARQREDVAGKRVVIVGGGDAALENALMLAERAADVVVVHRREEFTARVDLLEPAKRNAKIEFMTKTVLTAITGDDTVEGVELENTETGERSVRATDHVLIRIGVEPNSDLFRGQIDLDDNGYVVTDRYCATSAPRVFAIGDIANPIAPTIAAAVGQASIAIKAAASCQNREA